MPDQTALTLIVAFAFPISILLAHWSFRHVLRAETQGKPSFQYGRSDFVALLIVSSYVFSILLYCTREPGVLVGTGASIGIYWCFGIQWANRAQFPQLWQRGIFLTLLQPFACFGFFMLISTPAYLGLLFVRVFGNSFLAIAFTAVLISIFVGGNLSMLVGFLASRLAPKPDTVECKA